MAIFDSFFPEQPSYLTGLLGEDEALKARQQAQQAGLLNTGLGLLMASGPSTQRQGLGQILAQGIMTGQQAYQGAYDKQLKDKVMAMQVGEMKRKLEEDAAYRRIAPQLFKTTPEQATYGAGEEGPTKTVTAPATQTLDPQMLQKLALIAPERAKTIAETQTALRKAGLGVRAGGENIDSPFLPYLNAQSPEVRTLANQLNQGYKSGVIDEETAYKRIESLGKMEDTYVGRLEARADRQLTRDIAAAEREAKKLELSADQQKQLTGIKNTVGAIQEFRDELDNFNNFAALSPSKRAAMNTKYRNMLLQAKEAYNLGVLNGPDLTLMEQIVTDPNSFKGQFVGKEAIDAQAAELTRIMRKVGSTVATKGKVGEEVAAPVSNKQTVAPAVSLPTFNDIQAEIERRKKGAR